MQTWANCEPFVLVGAMNPCPCGYYGDEKHECTYSMGMVQRYQKRISGPLLDRIDIHLDVRSVPYQELSALESGEPSSAIRLRVESARTVQKDRFIALGKPGVQVNGDMGGPYMGLSEVQTFCALDEA